MLPPSLQPPTPLPTSPTVVPRAGPLRNGTMTRRGLGGGQGDPLVYIHGAGGLMWDPFVEALASQFTVYAPEHPGSGESTGLEEVRDIWDLEIGRAHG